MIPQCYMELNEDFNILRFFSPYKFFFKAWIKKKKKLQKVIRKIGSDSQKMIKIDE